MSFAHRSRYFAKLGILAVTAVACAKDQESAEHALAEIDAIVNSDMPEASIWLPEQATNVERKLTALKAIFDREEYSAVLAGSPALLAEARAIAAEAGAKRLEAEGGLLREWTALDASMPPLVAAVRIRTQSLRRAGHQHKRVDLSGAEANIAVGEELWDEAESAFESGRLEDALALLRDAKPKAEATAAALQLSHTGTD